MVRIDSRLRRSTDDPVFSCSLEHKLPYMECINESGGI